LFEDQFGGNVISTGTYNFGSLSVDVYPSNLGLIVDILDIDTGEQTQVIVPGS
jgi:curli production assembly/transport component CsgF